MEDRANVVGRPPAVTLASLSIGIILQLVFPVEIVPGFLTWTVGVPLAVVALVLLAAAIREFGKYGTPVRGTRPVVTIVSTGPYQFSRNPIYLSFLLLQLGIALVVNSAWILLMIIPTFLYLSIGVIAREESYLSRKFGEEYAQYKESVRRWI